MIQINLLRVSPDSQWLEFSVECPAGYKFNTLYIARYDIVTKLYGTTFDCSSLLLGPTPEGTTKEIMRIATSAFGTDVTMYKVEFGAAPTAPEGVIIDHSIGICSNINFVYANLLDLILNLNDCCLSCEDYGTLVRNNMVLYAHEEAIRLERYTEAEYFYDILWKLFVTCGPTTRQTNKINTPCNCN